MSKNVELDWLDSWYSW